MSQGKCNKCKHKKCQCKCKKCKKCNHKKCQCETKTQQVQQKVKVNVNAPAGAQGVTGAPGVQGITGAPGAQGVTGAPGVRGITGAPGVQGITGAPGAQGVTGAPGVRGITGAPGVQGITGAPGAQGITGAPGAGITGAPGATGASGSIPGFAYIYDTTSQTLAAGAAVTFNTNGVIAPAGFVAHTAESDAITISQTGTYLINYEVFPQQGTSAFALFAGAAQLAGSNYGSRSGNQTYSGQIITPLTAGTVLTLRNIDGATTLNNSTSGPGSTPVLSASIIIEQLA